MKSHKQKILELLLERYPGYVTNFEMNEKICFRYGGRICDLRREGWEIENKQVKENPQEWRARLLKPYNEKNLTKTKTENRVCGDSDQTGIGGESQMRVLQPASGHLSSLHPSGQEQLFAL